MKPSQRKQKGKNFENKISDLLHKHFYKVNKEYRELFDTIGNDNLSSKRSFSSGAISSEDGDIQLNLLKPYFPYSVECKHHKDLNVSLNSILKNDLKKLLNIWETQVVPKAKEVKLKPLLVFKANYTDIFVMCRVEDVNLRNVGNYIMLQDKVILLFKDFLDNFKR